MEMIMHPPIRTYGRIHGRTSSNWPFDTEHPPAWYSTSSQSSLPLMSSFSTNILEVGFGMGDSLFEMARNSPEIHFIGAEIYEPGVVKLCRNIVSSNLTNLSIIQGDVLATLQQLPPESLDRIHVYFPDPWPKIRHHKRRLHRGPFFSHCQRPLKSEGHIHLATDIGEYAVDWRKHTPDNWIEVHDDPWVQTRQTTKYENRGQRLGHNITDIVFKKHSQHE